MASADLTKPSVRFGTDGWRGVIGDDFTFDNVGLVARAVARTFEVRKRPPPAVPIGFDPPLMAAPLPPPPPPPPSPLSSLFFFF